MTEQDNLIDLLAQVDTFEDLVSTFPPDLIEKLGGGKKGVNDIIALLIGLAPFAPPPATFEKRAFNEVVAFHGKTGEKMSPEEAQSMFEVGIQAGFLKRADMEKERYLSHPQVKKIVDKFFKENEEENPPSLEVLVSKIQEAVSRFKVLAEEADSLLYADRDAEGSKKKLIEKAQVIIDLSLELKGLFLSKTPNDFEAKILYKVESHAILAQQAIDSENIFGLEILLIRKGSKIGDKNDLENLIDEIGYNILH